MRNRHISFSALVLLLAATIVAQPTLVVAQNDNVDDLIEAEMQRLRAAEREYRRRRPR